MNNILPPILNDQSIKQLTPEEMEHWRKEREAKANQRKAIRIMATLSMDLEYEMSDFEKEIVSICKKYL